MPQPHHAAFLSLDDYVLCASETRRRRPELAHAGRHAQAVCNLCVVGAASLGFAASNAQQQQGSQRKEAHAVGRFLNRVTPCGSERHRQRWAASSSSSVGRGQARMGHLYDEVAARFFLFFFVVSSSETIFSAFPRKANVLDCFLSCWTHDAHMAHPRVWATMHGAAVPQYHNRRASAVS